MTAVSVVNTLGQHFAAFRVNDDFIFVTVLAAHVHFKMIAVPVVLEIYVGYRTGDGLAGCFSRFVESDEIIAVLLVVPLIIIGTRRSGSEGESSGEGDERQDFVRMIYSVQIKSSGRPTLPVRRILGGEN